MLPPSTLRDFIRLAHASCEVRDWLLGQDGAAEPDSPLERAPLHQVALSQATLNDSLVFGSGATVLPFRRDGLFVPYCRKDNFVLGRVLFPQDFSMLEQAAGIEPTSPGNKGRISLLRFAFDTLDPTNLWLTARRSNGAVVIGRMWFSPYGAIAGHEVYCSAPQPGDVPREALSEFLITRSCPFCDDRHITCACSFNSRVRHWASLPNGTNWSSFTGAVHQNLQDKHGAVMVLYGGGGAVFRKSHYDSFNLYGNVNDAGQRLKESFVQRVSESSSLAASRLQPQLDEARPGLFFQRPGMRSTPLGATIDVLSAIVAEEDPMLSTESHETQETSEDQERNLRERALDLVAEGVCGVCSDRFSNKSNLKRHLRTAHNIDTRKRRKHSLEYKCHVCGQDFVQKSNLTRHISGVHGTQKVYACALCPTSFANRENLTRHYRKLHHAEVVGAEEVR